jgi:hypothetical protein
MPLFCGVHKALVKRLGGMVVMGALLDVRIFSANGAVCTREVSARALAPPLL